MKTAAGLCSAALVLLAVAGRPGAAAGADQVKVTDGIVEGVLDASTGIRSFKGVPFAAPPTGERRWKAPQPVEKWVDVRRADQFGPRCMQPPSGPPSDMVFRSNGMSEDCLYLNIWTPAKSASERLPVLVYFFGGGYVAGDGSEPRYDGGSMATKGIVALTVNYRLSIMGFFAHPELTKESPNRSSGNYALLDHVAALQWVRDNIAAFGGDPSRVTIAGESAGSVSVSAIMASPLAKGLIAGAIGESGAMITPTLPAVPLADAEQRGTYVRRDEQGGLARRVARHERRGSRSDSAACRPGDFPQRSTAMYCLPRLSTSSGQDSRPKCRCSSGRTPRKEVGPPYSEPISRHRMGMRTRSNGCIRISRTKS